MNLPNILTVTRILLIPFFLNFLLYGYVRLAFFTFVAAGITDALDGAVARFTNTKTELGATLDPMADKLLALAAFVALTITGQIPLWLTIAVITRDVVIVAGSAALYFNGYNFKVRPVITGKVATFCQLTLLSLALVEPYYQLEPKLMYALAWVTLAVTAVSGAQYVVRGFGILAKAEKNNRG